MDVEIKRESLYKMYDGSTESIIEVFDAFLDSEKEVVEDLDSAFSNADESTIRKQLHYHAPIFGYIGFPQVTLFIKDMENKYKNAVAPREKKLDHNELISTLKQVTSLLVIEKELMKTTAHA